MSIQDYGWNTYFAEHWQEQAEAQMFPGRVVADFGQKLRIVCETGELEVARPLVKENQAVQIAVGDWVALEQLNEETVGVCFVLPRKTKFSRAAAGNAVKEQVVAANADIVFLMQSLNRDFNMKRLERYLIAAWDSGATPVVVLTKTDCCDDVAAKLAKAYDTALGVEVHAVSCLTKTGLKDILRYFAPGRTVALLGSSGVGKSTLVNMLLGKEQFSTQAIRENDSRGRHTTTHRELILLPGGGLIMDTPGMRALSLWEAEQGMEIMFGDVEELVQQCRFADCQHQTEPDCAVRSALESGTLELQRWESWLKLQKEKAHLTAKKEGTLRLQQKQWGKYLKNLQKERSRK